MKKRTILLAALVAADSRLLLRLTTPKGTTIVFR